MQNVLFTKPHRVHCSRPKHFADINLIDMAGFMKATGVKKLLASVVVQVQRQGLPCLTRTGNCGLSWCMSSSANRSGRIVHTPFVPQGLTTTRILFTNPEQSLHEFDSQPVIIIPQWTAHPCMAECRSSSKWEGLLKSAMTVR